MSGEIIGVSALRDILPCRPSMLLLDRVFAESENKLIGLKSISMNEPCFMGHFPGHPILPGVLQVEAIRQLGELAVRPALDPAGEKDVYIRVLEKVKFRRPNNPGDRMKVEAEIVEIRDNSEAVVKAKTMNNGGKVSLLGILPPSTQINWSDVIFKGLFLKGIYGREMFETWYKMGAMIEAGLDISPIITHRFKIDDFQKGFDAMRSGQSGKVVLDWE